MNNQVLAICLKTYPDEDDMGLFYEGELEPCDVKIYHKGEEYLVNPQFDEEYYKLCQE